MDCNDWNTRYASADLVWGTAPNRFVVAALEARTPYGRALDLACGEGRNAIWLADRGWAVTAVDFSEIAIARAKKLAESRDVGIEWLRADLASYEPSAGAFSLVLIAYLQIPGPELGEVLARAAAALASGGELLMIGHARRNLAEGVGGPGDPDVLWTCDELDREFCALGLSGAHSEYVRRSVDTPDGAREAIDVLARAHKDGGTSS